MKKIVKVYEKPAFLAAPIGVICSKTGCPRREVSLMDETAFRKDVLVGESGIPVLPQDFNTRADKECLYIFEPAMQHIFSLNETASFIIRNIDGKKSIGDIAKLLEGEYEKTPDTVAYETSSLINSLRNAGLKITLKSK